MGYKGISDWSGSVKEVKIGATKSEGGTRSISYTIGGDRDLSVIDTHQKRPLIAFEICDDPALWPEVIREYYNNTPPKPAEWAIRGEKELCADLIRLALTSTKKRGFGEYESITETVRSVLSATTLPLIIEGSNDPEIDSEVFQRCGEAGQGERLLLGTAEASRYRSVAAAAMAYDHSVIAQSPIDVNLAKQLNILLRETGVPDDRIVIDPFTGALGYGFEYSYSTMERIKFSALKGDTDLAMPMISSPSDTLTVKEVRESEDKNEISVAWEVYTNVAAAVAGASIVVVRHPDSIKPLREALDALWPISPGGI